MARSSMIKVIIMKTDGACLLFARLEITDFYYIVDFCHCLNQK